MWSLKRSRGSGSDPTGDSGAEQPSHGLVDWAKRRKQPLACAGCKQVRPPYVYTENDKEYCIDCAKTNLTVLRLFPAGKRADDIKLEDLLADDENLRRRLGVPPASGDIEDDESASEPRAS